MRIKFGTSIFVRLLSTHAIAGILVLFIVVLSFWLFEGKVRNKEHERLVSWMSDVIVGQLGDPPSRIVASLLAAKTGIQVSYRGKYGEWTTSSVELPLSVLQKDPQGNKRRMYHGMPVCRVVKESGEFCLGMGVLGPSPKRFFLFLIVGVMIVLIGTYIYLRCLLRPIGLLSDGVSSIMEGHLDKEIQVLVNNELGALTQAFNDMTSQLKEMIESKEQLLLDVSHELRSPITRMKVSAEFIADEKVRLDLQEDMHELEMMIDETLEIARLDKAEQRTDEVFDICPVLLRIVSQYQDLAPGVVYTASETPIMMRGDHRLIIKAVRNVIDNAYKYSKHQAKPVELNVEIQTAWILVRVIDYGVGISAEERKRVFEPFYRADKSRSRETGGYGLGLSLVKRIIEVHSGSIEIESELMKGTTVCIRFPRQSNSLLLKTV